VSSGSDCGYELASPGGAVACEMRFPADPGPAGTVPRSGPGPGPGPVIAEEEEEEEDEDVGPPPFLL